MSSVVEIYNLENFWLPLGHTGNIPSSLPAMQLSPSALPTIQENVPSLKIIFCQSHLPSTTWCGARGTPFPKSLWGCCPLSASCRPQGPHNCRIRSVFVRTFPGRDKARQGLRNLPYLRGKGPERGLFNMFHCTFPLGMVKCHHVPVFTSGFGRGGTFYCSRSWTSWRGHSPHGMLEW